jgi:hypothetical protein
MGGKSRFSAHVQDTGMLEEMKTAELLTVNREGTPAKL